MIDVYEYYDEYEHIWRELPENERSKVQYFVIDSIQKTTIICYVGETPHVTKIGMFYHNDAWKVGEISIKEAIEYLKCDYKEQNIFKMNLKIQNLVLKKQLYDDFYNIKAPNSKRTMSDGDIHIEYTCTDSFTDVYVKALEEKKKMLMMRDKFLEELMHQYAIEQLLHHKAKLIQKCYKEAITNPKYSLCRKRLLLEFQSIS